jgi:AhpC/TSA family
LRKGIGLDLKLKSVARKIAKAFAVVVVLYAVLTVALFTLMLQGPDRFAGVMRYVPWPAFVVLPFKPLWKVARGGTHSVGEVAPDFSLESVDHKSTVQLSSYRGQKPVVLVFGSYT